jgi:hypothetical protein
MVNEIHGHVSAHMAFYVLVCSDRWNCLDLLIAVLSLTGIVFEEVQSTAIPINPTIVRVMRILRITRGNKVL